MYTRAFQMQAILDQVLFSVGLLDQTGLNSSPKIVFLIL